MKEFYAVVATDFNWDFHEHLIAIFDNEEQAIELVKKYAEEGENAAKAIRGAVGEIEQAGLEDVFAEYDVHSEEYWDYTMED